jgi:ribonuclease HI
MTITIHTDGGSRGNPGPAALGYVISIPGKEKIAEGEYLGETTNNVAEYTAILRSLQKVVQILGESEAKKTQIKLFLDSELAQRQLTGVYKVKNAGLKPLVQQIWNIENKFDTIVYNHVKRALNIEADTEVNKVLDAYRYEK